MPSYVSDTGGGDFAQCPEGTHIAVCDQVINLGVQKNEYQGEISYKNQHYIRWQIPAERTKWRDKDGHEHEGPMTVSAFWTSSLSEMANMRKHLEAWRGRAFTQDELQRFDIFAVLGKACQVSVGRTASGKAKINAIMALPKGMAAPEVEGETVGYDAEHAPEGWDKVSPGIKKIIERSSEGGSVDHDPVSLEPEFSDDIPF